MNIKCIISQSTPIKIQETICRKIINIHLLPGNPRYANFNICICLIFFLHHNLLALPPCIQFSPTNQVSNQVTAWMKACSLAKRSTFLLVSQRTVKPCTVCEYRLIW